MYLLRNTRFAFQRLSSFVLGKFVLQLNNYTAKHQANFPVDVLRRHILNALK